ncbi:NRPS protein [Paecilomyces lecythidis]|uniref:NRPS protein n=1 Tax=Paecilomyces lecythidis TaxID=3004212 RepID=A0ABR3XL20_9EURO
MDPTLPLARLQNMAMQVGAKMMVTSRKQYSLSRSVMENERLIIVEEDTFKKFPDFQCFPELVAVPPSTLMYMIFTSGSTGTPKGVKISHETYTSSAIPRSKAVGYTESSRVLDFASYAFDVSIDSMLLTFGNGGCLCIPSDEDRLNDINEVIRKMRVNYAGLTPSVARILDSDVIASLSGLGLGGEAVSARDVMLWGQVTRIIIGYGPCECTIGCTVNSSAATGKNYISIGKGNGAVIWIVDPNNHESLMPVGAVGELLVEGPIVGQGYLNDPEKTATSFIHNPSWLISGYNGYPGRQGRLYKTGDLGRYDPDGSGSIVFVGRKDTQVKLRGQRVELGEIESQLKARLPSDTAVIAEVITPLGSGGQPTLVAFVALQATKRNQDTGIKLAQLSEGLRGELSKTDTGLAKVLPRYMVPTAYIPVNYIPVLISGKTDRKRLREFGATIDLRKLDPGTSTTVTRELSDVEQRLRWAWGQVLKVDQDTIRPDDNFITLGGDSLAAMRLVSVCRAQGLDITVADTFNCPTLSSMAGSVHTGDLRQWAETPAFSMLSQDIESACLEASSICGVSLTAIEDIYPCTPTQESLFTFSLKSTKAYIAQRIALIPSHIKLDTWKKAWGDVFAESAILRTRLAQLQHPGLQQVVVKETIPWIHSTDLAKYLDRDKNRKMELGQSLARYAIIDDLKDGKRYMVWTVHHVLYDGWSEPLILKKIRDALEGRHTKNQAQIKDFVKYVRDTDETAMQEFWKQELQGAVGPQFPRLPYRDYLPTPDSEVEQFIPLNVSGGWPFTLATLIRGAWALVAAQYTGSDDVVFGETLTGRDITLPDVESIIGPLIATIPIRIHIRRENSIEAFMHNVQQVMSARAPYQHMGMQYIRKVSQDAQYACEAGTGLVIQPEPEYVGNELGFEKGDVVREALHFNPYPLMLACGIRKDGFRICASFDSKLVEITQMKRILAQLRTACLKLTTENLSAKISEISLLPEEELDQIWRWNQIPPLSLDISSKILRADETTKQGSIYPPVIVPWVCNPRNPTLLSPIGCVGELWLEGTFFPGNVLESPAWLVAGSSTYAGRTGVVQATGDLVRLQDNGSLVFIGRKDNVIPVQGHEVDLTDLESHFPRYLPQACVVAAASKTPSGISHEISEREIIVFIEQDRSEEDTIEIMSLSPNVSWNTARSQSFQTAICSKVHISLAMALRTLDKFIRDSLPSYMIPAAYVVVEKMPTEAGHIDRKLLNELASNISDEVLHEVYQGLKDAWTKCSSQRHVTANENILRSSWAKVLGMDIDMINLDDNFFRLGGDSVLAMKLVSSLRAQGYILTVADIFQHMRLEDAAEVLKEDQGSKKPSRAYEPFTVLGCLDVEQFLSEIIRPNLEDSKWPIQDVLPVTDTQALDVRATIHAPRTSIQYTLLYLDKGVRQKQLLEACEGLLKTHDILRTIFIENDSTIYQVVLAELDHHPEVHQADKDLGQYVTELCATDIESSFRLGSSFLKMTYIQGNHDQNCLVLRLSHAQYDGTSLPRLLRDLETLYTGGTITGFEPFSSYMSKVCDESAQREARDYWYDLLRGSSLSVLEERPLQPTDRATFKSKPVDISKRPPEITAANLLTAAWALVLARHLQVTDVTFGSVTSGRSIDLANVENVVGPCYHLTPVRVRFEPQWKTMDLLRFVQSQSARSAAYDFIGFEKIFEECTEWSRDIRSFDSIVHHQDFEDFDSMPFAGGNCRVDISNPHGDAAYPFKAVSFARNGTTYFGMVGSERDPTFVDKMLEKLAAAVQELTSPSENALLDERTF